MSTRKKRVMLIATIAGVVAAMSAVLFMPRGDRINSHYCRKIKSGMTLAEVEEVLGCPPGDYRAEPRKPDTWTPPVAPGALWRGERLTIYVVLDGQNRVKGFSTFHPLPLRSSWYRALQEWIALPD
jgi:hypothetical protein